MSLDGVPYIGQYSKRTPNLYVACGFNKWGMTGAMVAVNGTRQNVPGTVPVTVPDFLRMAGC